MNVEIVAKRGRVKFTLFGRTEDEIERYVELRNDTLFRCIEGDGEHIIRGPIGGPFQIDKDRHLEGPPVAYTEEDLMFYYNLGRELETALRMINETEVTGVPDQ